MLIQIRVSERLEALGLSLFILPMAKAIAVSWIAMLALLCAWVRRCRSAMPDRSVWCVRASRVLAVGLGMVFGVFIGSNAWAQTAHFAYDLSTLTSGPGIKPTGVAVDAQGNVYVSEQEYNSVVEFVNLPAGYTPIVINTGNAPSLPNGLAARDTPGNESIYVASSGNDKVLELSTSDFDYISTPWCDISTSALGLPNGVAMDANGDVFVSDDKNNQVVELTSSPGNCTPYGQTTIASGLNSPAGVAVDSVGNVYIADRLNGRVLLETWHPPVWPAAGYFVQSTIVSGFNPLGIAVDAGGNLYVSNGIGQVFKEAPSTGGYTQSNFLSFPNSSLWAVQNIAVDANGNLFLAIPSQNMVVERTTAAANFGLVSVGNSATIESLFFTFDTGGTLGSKVVVTQGATGLGFSDAGTGTCKAGMAYSAGESCSVEVKFAPKFSGTRYGAVVLYDNSGNVIATGYLQGSGQGPQVEFLPAAQSTIASGLNSDSAVAVDAGGDVYVADTQNNRVLKLTPAAGSYSQSVVVDSGLSAPSGVAVDGAGNIYIADSNNQRVLKETLSGGGYTQSVVADGLHGTANGVAVDGNGNVYISVSLSDITGQVVKETPSGSSYIESTVATGLGVPVGVAVDGGGNVYVVDNGFDYVLKERFYEGSYTRDIIADGAASGGLYFPWGVAVDGNGNVFVTDSGLQQLVMESPVVPVEADYGIYVMNYQQTIIATGLHQPEGIALDGSGNAFIAGGAAGQVVEENFASPPNIEFASTPLYVTSADGQTWVIVENLGNAPLAFPYLPVLNPSITEPFSIGSSSCPTATPEFQGYPPLTLAAGSSCVLLLSFTPTETGSITGSLTLTDNTLNAAAPSYAVQSIQLSGIGFTDEAPVITAPTPGTVLGTSGLTFTWTHGGSYVGEYEFRLGNAIGSADLYFSGSLWTTSVMVPTLPSSGATVYAQLWYEVNGTWQIENYTYTESPGAPAVLSSPTPGSTLGTTNLTFTWTPGTGVSNYQLYLGTIPGSTDLFRSTRLTTTSVTVPTLPSSGATVYATLWSEINGVWRTTTTTYTEPPGAPAVLTSPTPGSVLGATNVTFSWTPGTGVSYYLLYLGPTAGSHDFYISTRLTTTSVTVPSLPSGGAMVYAQLWSEINGAWTSSNYTYTEP